MSKILEYTIYIIVGFAIIFIIEEIRITKKYNKKLYKRICRAKRKIHETNIIKEDSCGIGIATAKSILEILEGKDNE